jgi:hypothetical protein
MSEAESGTASTTVTILFLLPPQGRNRARNRRNCRPISSTIHQRTQKGTGMEEVVHILGPTAGHDHRQHVRMWIVLEQGSV